MQCLRLFALVVLSISAAAHAADPASPPTEAQAWEAIQPYDGAHSPSKPTPTMSGKVFCGYQGWFNAPGDGSALGWRHWTNADTEFEPGHCTIDLWPDVSDLTPAERVETKFKHADGSPAYVFSAHNPITVKRHFAQMAEYGIDGAFVQRFAVETRDAPMLRHRNVVLAAARAGSNENGRSYAVMYDLSGLGEGETQVVIDDWKRLVDRAKLTRDPNDTSYLRHEGKPVVAVWGIGFNRRQYTLDECGKLLDFLKNDPTYGGNLLVVGVPANWRTLGDGATGGEALHRVLAKADILSPWTVGRQDTPEGIRTYGAKTLTEDLAWARERKMEILPVIFPGFSWHNLKGNSPSDRTPRKGGTFFWQQAVAATRSNAGMLYVAMFDEVDEGTAIFKLTNDPPVGASPFVNEKTVPPDHYLWLTGEIGRMLRGERKVADEMPKRD